MSSRRKTKKSVVKQEQDELDDVEEVIDDVSFDKLLLPHFSKDGDSIEFLFSVEPMEAASARLSLSLSKAVTVSLRGYVGEKEIVRETTQAEFFHTTCVEFVKTGCIAIFAGQTMSAPIWQSSTLETVLSPLRTLVPSPYFESVLRGVMLLAHSVNTTLSIHLFETVSHPKHAQVTLAKRTGSDTIKDLSHGFRVILNDKLVPTVSSVSSSASSRKKGNIFKLVDLLAQLSAMFSGTSGMAAAAAGAAAASSSSSSSTTSEWENVHFIFVASSMSDFRLYLAPALPPDLDSKIVDLHPDSSGSRALEHDFKKQAVDPYERLLILCIKRGFGLGGHKYILWFRWLGAAFPVYISLVSRSQKEAKELVIIGPVVTSKKQKHKSDDDDAEEEEEEEEHETNEEETDGMLQSQVAKLEIIKPDQASFIPYPCFELTMHLLPKAHECSAYIHYLCGSGGCALYGSADRRDGGPGKAYLAAMDRLMPLLTVQFAELQDEAFVECKDAAETRVNLRLFRLMKKGLPFYTDFDFWPQRNQQLLVTLYDLISKVTLSHILTDANWYYLQRKEATEQHRQLTSGKLPKRVRDQKNEEDMTRLQRKYKQSTGPLLQSSASGNAGGRANDGEDANTHPSPYAASTLSDVAFKTDAESRDFTQKIILVSSSMAQAGMNESNKLIDLITVEKDACKSFQKLYDAVCTISPRMAYFRHKFETVDHMMKKTYKKNTRLKL